MNARRPEPRPRLTYTYWPAARPPNRAAGRIAAASRASARRAAAGRESRQRRTSTNPDTATACEDRSRCGRALIGRWRAICAVAAAASIAACARQAEWHSGAAPNVLLITVDTLRADALGVYGNRSVSTPWIDRLAAGGVRFTQARASAVVTLPSHATILSGLYPVPPRRPRECRLPFSAAGRDARDAAACAPLSDRRLRQRVSARCPIRPDARVRRLRRSLPEERRHRRVPRAGAAGDRTRWLRRSTGSGASGAAGTEAPADRQAPWLAWVHLYEPHFPYVAAGAVRLAAIAAAPYLGEVAAVDAALGPLLQPILDGQGGRDTLVVLTADHGESLGEHGEMTHGLFAYDATLRVPLIVYEPHRLGARVVAEPVRHVDIVPTILDAIDGTAPPSARRPEPAADRRGQGRAIPALAYFESLSASINRGWAPLYGVTRGSLKYIDLPIPELYDLAADPAESHDLVASRPAEARELQRLLDGLRGDERPGRGRHARTPTRASCCAALGISPAPRRRRRISRTRTIPNGWSTSITEIDEVVSRYQRGDLPGAIALGERLVERRPDMAHLARAPGVSVQPGRRSSACRWPRSAARWR